MTQQKCFSSPANRQKAVFWLEAAGAFFCLFLRNRKFCFPQVAKRLPFAESAGISSLYYKVVVIKAPLQGLYATL